MKWGYSKSGDILYEIRGETYNLESMLGISDWRSQTDHMRMLFPELVLYQQKKSNAKAGEKLFTLVVEDIKIGQECPVTGECFEVDCLDERWGTPYAPSIDQIRAGQGYTAKNVLVMRLDWNVFKADRDWVFLRGLIGNRPAVKAHAETVTGWGLNSLTRHGIKTADDFIQQLGGWGRIDGRIIRMLIALEHELWINGEIQTSACKTILEHEPEMLDGGF